MVNLAASKLSCGNAAIKTCTQFFPLNNCKKLAFFCIVKLMKEGGTQ